MSEHQTSRYQCKLLIEHVSVTSSNFPLVEEGNLMKSPAYSHISRQKFTCQHCSDKFTPKDLSPSHLKRNPPKYCTRNCRDDANKNRVVIVCSNPNCKKLKEKIPCELKEHPCCDTYCANEWKRACGIFAGKNNPAWRGGISCRYRGENWDEQREKALERDKYICQRCGLIEREIELRNPLALEVHHIKPYCLFSDYIEANHLENLRTLCRVCHMIEEHQYIRLHPEEPQLRRIPKTRPPSKPCIDCHEIFEPLRHSDKACNKCMTIRCLNCGKDHHVEEYRMTKRQKFCSGECVTEYIGHNNRKIDQVIVVKMKALRDQGLSYKEIAAKVGFSKCAVRTNLIKSYGCDVIEHPFTHVYQDMFEGMKALRDQGLSTRKIAAEIGIGKSTAARYIKRPILSFPIPRRGLVGKVNQDIIEKMKALRDKGSSYTKIATILGVCRQTVKIHLKSYKHGIAVSHPSRKVTPAMIEEMKILRNEGLPYERIGAKLGVIGNTVWKYLKSYKPIYVVLSRNRIHKILTHLQYSW